MTIQDIIQKEVNEIAKVSYEKDECPPRFTVSVYGRKLILTIEHMGQAFSEDIFPADDMTYGLYRLEELMDNLYARTM